MDVLKALQDSYRLSNKKREKLYGVEIRQIPGLDQYGVFSSRDIWQGEVVIESHPLISAQLQLDEPLALPLEPGVLHFSVKDWVYMLSPEDNSLPIFDYLSPRNSDKVEQLTRNVFCHTPIQRADLYGVPSFVNHGCTPNLLRTFGDKDTRQIFTARRDIKAGEELTNAYTYHMPSDSAKRKQFLQMAYNFDCLCPDCVNNRANDFPVCATCGKGGKLLQCPLCDVKFCNKDCQKKIWRQHVKHVCNKA